MCLDEPTPLFQVLSFADSAIQIQFSTWVVQDNFVRFKTDLHIAVKKAFDETGVEIPFPQRSLNLQEPLSVRLLDSQS